MTRVLVFKLLLKVVFHAFTGSSLIIFLTLTNFGSMCSTLDEFGHVNMFIFNAFIFEQSLHSYFELTRSVSFKTSIQICCIYLMTLFALIYFVKSFFFFLEWNILLVTVFNHWLKVSIFSLTHIMNKCRRRWVDQVFF